MFFITRYLIIRFFSIAINQGRVDDDKYKTSAQAEVLWIPIRGGNGVVVRACRLIRNNQDAFGKASSLPAIRSQALKSVRPTGLSF